MKKNVKIGIFFIFILLIFIFIYKNKDNILKNVYPIKNKEIVEKYSDKYKIDKYLVFACIKAESNFKEDVVSKMGAKGLMQLMSSTAEEVAKPLGISVDDKNIFDPDININLGTKYLSSLLSKYGNKELALAAYNAGSGNVDNWIKNGIINADGANIDNIPYEETRKYVKKIIRDYDIYINLYEKR